MNSVVLIGNLTKDPDTSYTPQQIQVTHFTLAVSRQRRNGEEQGADFIRVTTFGKQAELCDRYLSKGRKIAIHGRIQTGSYKNRDGITVYTTDVIADNVEFLGQKDQKSEQPADHVEVDMSNLPDSFHSVDDGVPF